MYNPRELFIGVDQQVPLLNGTFRTYVNFDNAATTPPFRSVVEAIESILPFYAGVHRGTGFKSLFSTQLYEHCRQIVARFVNADPQRQVVIFTRNTTDAINQICHHLVLQPDEFVLTTVMEHHSDLLPWWLRGQVDYVRITDDVGALDINHLQQKLEQHKGKVRLVAICGASNVTGFVPPIAQIARLVHSYDALLLIDAAQLVAHRRVNMNPPATEEAIDFLAFSAHKMYAPFGIGVIVGPKTFFENRHPAIVGGGTIEFVTLEEVEWAEPPEKEEPGTPNLIGVVALTKAIEMLLQIGFPYIEEHERQLTSYFLQQLREIPEVIIYGDSDPQLRIDRIGVIPINLQQMEHGLLASILGYEWGIGVRHGCFCAHPYIMSLLKLSRAEIQYYRQKRHQKDLKGIPGFVRISLGLYNTIEEIDYFIEALQHIIRTGPQARYRFVPQTGEYFPENFNYNFSVHFPFKTKNQEFSL